MVVNALEVPRSHFPCSNYPLHPVFLRCSGFNPQLMFLIQVDGYEGGYIRIDQNPTGYVRFIAHGNFRTQTLRSSNGKYNVKGSLQ